MTLAKYGKKEYGLLSLILCPLLLISIAAGIVIAPAGYAFAVLFFLAWAAGIAFYRDPERKIPADDNLILAPADGLIRDIELIPASDCEHLATVFEGRDMLRIGIYISTFDVRINRAPCKFTVKLRELKESDGPGNDSLMLAGTAAAGGKEFPMGIKQIFRSGTEHSACEPVPGDQLFRGDRFGMIKFGSRLELYLPAKSNLVDIKVGVGDRVQAGLTTIVEFTGK
ncbi:MAG: phosphatidylserine decarboxylase [Lentisphaeria bacterium]|nr:phosphatidylserine decarboxylase [Lentisphaeria bacterium]